MGCLGWGKIYINDVWPDRQSDLNFKVFATVPAGPVTLASLANPAYVRRGLDMNNPTNQIFTFCYLSIQASTQKLAIPAYAPKTTTAAAGLNGKHSTTTAAVASVGVSNSGFTSSSMQGPSACPAPSDLMCCSHAVKSQLKTLIVNFSIDVSLVSVEILWPDASAPMTASALEASGAWSNLGLSIVSQGVASGCLLLGGTNATDVPGFVSRQLFCGPRTVGRQVLLSLPDAAQAALAGLTVRMCVTKSTNATGGVTLSIQSLA